MKRACSKRMWAWRGREKVSFSLVPIKGSLMLSVRSTYRYRRYVLWRLFEERWRELVRSFKHPTTLIWLSTTKQTLTGALCWLYCWTSTQTWRTHRSLCAVTVPSFERDESISVCNGSKNEPWDTLRVSLGVSGKKHWTDSSMFILYRSIISIIVSCSPNSDIQRRYTSRPNFSGILVVNRLWVWMQRGEKGSDDSTYLQQSTLNVSRRVREKSERLRMKEEESQRSLRTGHSINCFRLRRLLWQIQTICSIECAEKLITQTAGFESSVRERKEWRVKMEKRNMEVWRDLGTRTSELRIAT